jgi:hypothetical protein
VASSFPESDNFRQVIPDECARINEIGTFLASESLTI